MGETVNEIDSPELMALREQRSIGYGEGKRDATGALRTYVQHKDFCAMRHKLKMGFMPVCSCGLHELLEEING